MFLDTDVYHQFVKDCRRVKIECPIVPGIMCITNLAGFWKMTSFCKTRVPAILREALLALHQDSENALKDFGIQYGVQQCQDLLSSEDPPAVLHFYTLNLEKVVYGVLHELGKLHNTGNETDATSSA